jgi:hypothetical protein
MKRMKSSAPLVVMTIGHSTRQVAEFISLLKAHNVKRLVDVRTIPRSRHNPQFNRDQLAAALHSARLHYRYGSVSGRLDDRLVSHEADHCRPDCPRTDRTTRTALSRTRCSGRNLRSRDNGRPDITHGHCRADTWRWPWLFDGQVRVCL